MSTVSPYTFDGLYCTSTFVSSVNTLRSIAFGVLVVLFIILIQLFILSRQLARCSRSSNSPLLSSRCLVSAAKRRKSLLSKRRNRFHFDLSNKIINSQSSSIKRSLLSSPKAHDHESTSLRETSEQAVQCHVEDFTSPSSHDQIPHRLQEEANQCELGNGMTKTSPCHGHVVQSNPATSYVPYDSAINHSLLSNNSLSANTPTSSCGNKLRYSSSSSTILISELESLGILDAPLGKYSMRKDGTKDFVIVKSNEVIAVFSIHPNRTIEIIKNGRVFTLIDASGKPVIFSIPMSLSAMAA